MRGPPSERPIYQLETLCHAMASIVGAVGKVANVSDNAAISDGVVLKALAGAANKPLKAEEHYQQIQVSNLPAHARSHPGRILYRRKLDTWTEEFLFVGSCNA